MIRAIVLFSLTAGLAFGEQLEPGQWHPAAESDARGPCPMMNTLANHGFLHRDGLNLTEDVVIKALEDGLNFDNSLSKTMFKMALPANPEPNATWFTLDQLNRHNVLEHDASLSRMDAYYGNNHLFNPSTFASSKSFWTSSVLSAQQLANSKLARQIDSRAFNPTYTFTTTMEQFSLGELAAPIIAFGDSEAGTADRALVEYFFENERLPTSLGWSKKSKPVTLQEILLAVQHIRNATNLITGNSTEATRSAHATRELHFGGGDL
ncbi:hypothetical protein Q7P35_010433 [Cladosporium inversicolor]